MAKVYEDIAQRAVSLAVLVERERCLQLLYEMSGHGVSYMDVCAVAALRSAIQDGRLPKEPTR